ncbi:unnamed protein product [Linum tenue]|uniref:Dolichol phosphate-mannose biosynthesis regulatory protein n=1 Tax=Linum tenue TaxID=586396 RepID=A0AAV0PI72_9ROSI|nr:unnamed protein product [Linum tenue]
MFQKQKEMLMVVHPVCSEDANSLVWGDQPFVDSDHFVHQYFLPLEYAIIIPVFAGVALLSLLSLFVGSVMLKSRKKNKKA